MGCNTDEAIYISVVLMSILNLQTVQRRHVGGQKAHAKSLTSGKLTLVRMAIIKNANNTLAKEYGQKGPPPSLLVGM